ncbi:hypothetical protein HELRODRAFT_168802 [Helobdella robusta]|uniref:VWFD domain-containing protein n=1 Tax=Helobdella robusta TaxID=6412 RepID=T1F0Z8_HELRO|nr:hypothetical protein HELRODRAFT_168802 [Helobdella robusta]ESO08884.1 hypothetical protein HELRODRAFT_168802 [Helobdella robusta]
MAEKHYPLLGARFWLTVTILCCSIVVVESANFYPFGHENGDNALVKQDDAFTTIDIDFDFHFFGLPYSKIHISTNGILYFGEGSNAFTPTPFPVNNTRSVAAYWVDSDPRFGGDIFYREDFRPAILGNLTDYIRSKFVQYNSFTSSWSLIVTFNQVPRYNCQNNQSCQNVVNHQTILTSDGIHSFVIFLYDKLQYSMAQIGFNAGDMKRYFLVPFSNTDKISEYALQNSNVGSPGEWMFSIGDEIASACNSMGFLQVYPKKVFYFGPQVLYISGPCLDKNLTHIRIKMFKFCPVIENKIKCTTSYSDNTTRVPIVFSVNNTEYKSFYIPFDSEDPLVKNSSFFNIFTSEQKFVDIMWNQLAFESDTVEIRGTQQDISYDGSGKIAKTEEKLFTINVSNTGKYRFDFLDPQQSLKATRIFLNIGYFVFEIFRHGIGTTCTSWYNGEPKTDSINQIADEEARRNPCQPLAPTTFPEQLPGGFKKDSSCNPSNPEACNIFHPGAKICYRSTNNPKGSAVQCCYNSDGRLVIGPPGGGSLSLIDSDSSKLGYFWNQIRPYLLCCKMSDDCDKFYTKRPSIDSRYYIPPRPARANGDPHFVTMDGTPYEFNPVGEFIYLQTPNTMVQARMKQFMVGDSPRPASYFSAFAIKVFDDVIFQIELASRKRLQLRIENQIWTDEVINLGSANVDMRNESDYNVVTTTGLSFHFLGINNMIHVISSLQPHLKGNVYGLIGNWDDNQANDLMFPNKTWIPVTSSIEEIHKTFGRSWSTTEETSIFSYPEGLSWRDFQNPDFSPFFGPLPVEPRCGNNTECIFDTIVTGDIGVGLTNVAVQDMTKNIIEENEKMIKTCDTLLTIPNGNITISKLNAHDLTRVNYSVSCNEHFKLRGNAFARCVDGNLLEPYGTCSFAACILYQFRNILILMLAELILNYF